jgi:mRNA-degrading endonuclease RelE of RelBE toxin-antitoxin system
VILTAHAERDLLRLPDELRQRVKRDILALSLGHIPMAQVKKLQGFSPPVWQLTSGRFRVLYRRQPEELLVLRVVAKPD